MITASAKKSSRPFTWVRLLGFGCWVWLLALTGFSCMPGFVAIGLACLPYSLQSGFSCVPAS
ncbi:hypothetical protein ACLBWT_08850 [Paenibacillus sp. D51F]